MILNHFPLRSDLQVAVSEYVHSQPQPFAHYLRGLGYTVSVLPTGVKIVHWDDRIPPVHQGAKNIHTMTIDPASANYIPAVESLIWLELARHGYVLERLNSSAFLGTRLIKLVTNIQKPAPLEVGAHLRWYWEIERHSDQSWLVLRPSRKFLTHNSWKSAAVRDWAAHLPEEITKLFAVNRSTSWRETLLRTEKGWQTPWESYKDNQWHLTMDMEQLAEMGLSDHAYKISQFTMPELTQEVDAARLWARFITTLEPLSVDVPKIGGAKLKFGRGMGREVTDIQKLGVLQAPAEPVRLITVIPNLESEGDEENLKCELLAHLLPREMVHKFDRAQKGLQLIGRRPDDDTLYTLWSGTTRYAKLGIQPFDVATGLYKYSITDGALQESQSIKATVEDAKTKKRLPVALVVLPNDIDCGQRNKIFQALETLGVTRCFPVARETLHIPRMQYQAWVSMAVRLARTAGGIPWEVQDLAGVNDTTCFIGIDLGHDHKNQQSIAAFTLHDFQGRPLRSFTTPCQLNERLNLTDMQLAWQHLFAGLSNSIQKIIVHRDGRFLTGETADFEKTLQQAGAREVALVEIKKSNSSAASETAEGDYLPLTHNRALLITKTQTELARPLEIAVVSSCSGFLTVQDAIDQVFWLTRVFMNNAQHASKIPATTHWANEIARTGSRSPLRGWNWQKISQLPGS